MRYAVVDKWQRRLWRVVFWSLVAGIAGGGLGYLQAGREIAADDIQRSRVISSDQSQGLDRLVGGREEGVDFELFWQMWELAQQRHYEAPALHDELLSGALNGVLRYGLRDRYSFFLPPGLNPYSQEGLGGNGTEAGITLDHHGSNFIVRSVRSELTESDVDIQPGDVILRIGERTTQGMTLFDAEVELFGRVGSPLLLELERVASDGAIERKTISYNRLTLAQNTIVWEKLSDDVFHVELRQFNQRTRAQWENMVTVLSQQNPRAILLDLRGNSGGFVDAVPSVVGSFVEEGVAYIREERDGSRAEIAIEGESVFGETPLVVLTNSGTASAAEMVATALRDQREIKTVGGTTFGKGVIQTFITVPVEGEFLPAMLGLVRARWYAPGGESVMDSPLVPDYQIALLPEDLRQQRDPVYQQGLEILNRLAGIPSDNGGDDAQ